MSTEMEEILSLGSRMGSSRVFIPYFVGIMLVVGARIRQSEKGKDGNEVELVEGIFVMFLANAVEDFIVFSGGDYAELGFDTILDQSIIHMLLSVSELYRPFDHYGATPGIMLFLLGLCMLGFGVMIFVTDRMFAKLSYIFFAGLSFLAALEVISWK